VFFTLPNPSYLAREKKTPYDIFSQHAVTVAQKVCEYKQL